MSGLEVHRAQTLVQSTRVLGRPEADATLALMALQTASMPAAAASAASFSASCRSSCCCSSGVSGLSAPAAADASFVAG